MLSDFKSSNGMSGAVFTQLVDVEQEINGFRSYDRISKVDIPKIKAINEKLIYQTITGKDAILPDASSSALTWKFTNVQPADDWMKTSFDDAMWQSGKAGFGAGAPPNSVINTEWNTADIWLRNDFKLSSIKPGDLKNLSFRIYYDDDYEIYINGILAASAKGHSSDYVMFPLNDAAKKALKPQAVNSVAVHCHQAGGGQFIDVGLFKLNFRLDSVSSEK